MSKRRRVRSLLGLAVLGVAVQRPMHPYEMASMLRARAKDRDIAIKWGSLYSVVQNLEKHGLLASIGTEREGGRPERTVYRLTDAGRVELSDWVSELVSAPSHEPRQFEAGLSMLAALAPEEAAAHLKVRLESLGRELDEKRQRLAALRAEIPRLFLIEGEYDLAMVQAEAEWAGSLHDELASGRFPDIEKWRAAQNTGQIAAQWGDIAERGSIPGRSGPGA